MRLLTVLSLCGYLSIANSIAVHQTKEISTPAIKDSTILRSTVSCPTCPDRNCYKCTLGHEQTLQANTGGLAYIRFLIGFELPVPSSSIKRCTMQLPAFTQLPQYPVNMTVSQATSSDWNEDTVNGENAPDSGEAFITVPIPALNNPVPIDITPACKNATNNCQFSIYVGTQFGRIEVWSKDSGNPAIVRITYV